MRRLLALSLIVAAAVVAVPSVAGGGLQGDELDVDLVDQNEPLTFSARFVDGPGCVEDAEFDYTVTANGEEVTPISAMQSDSDSDEFLFVLPNDTTPGILEIDLSCDNGEGTSHASDAQDWSGILVRKVVTGTAPAGTTFTINVACENEVEDVEVGGAEVPPEFNVDLHYTVAGGDHYVYTDDLMVCAVTEPVNGGATTVTIVPPAVTMDDFGPFSVTVTNAFPTAAAPQTTQPNFTG